MGRQPQTKQSRALAIGRKIAELEAEIRPILQAIKDLKAEHDRLFEPEEPVASVPKLKGKKRKSGSDEWTPLKARLLQFFSTVDEHGADVDTISEGVGDPNRQTLRAALVELTKAGQLTRIGKGVYKPRVMALVMTR